MRCLPHFLTKRFGPEEDGAVTVDWVVLTAGIVGLAILAFALMETSTLGLSSAAGGEIDSRRALIPTD